MLRSAFYWLVPHPSLTLVLTVTWLFLQNSFAPGMVVFGLILGILIPRMTAIWWPDPPRGVRLGRMVSYGALVVWDILVANVQVAWVVLTVPNSRLRSEWIVIPLELKHPEAITLLAGTITLTPGTVSADLSDKGHSLLVHVLHTDDPDAVRDEIKERYERRLLEMFS